MLDEGLMAEARVETLKQERKEVYVALQYVASFHWQWRNGKIVRNSNQSRKKIVVLSTRGVKECRIEQTGARKRTGIDV